MAGLDVIHLHGLEFYAYHGVLPEEQRLGQRFTVDLDMYTDLALAGHSDEVEDTINYAEVYQAVRDCVEGAPFRLVERLAEHIAQTVLSRFACQEVRVEVHKPQAPIPGIFQDVSVEIRREKER